MPYAQYLKGKVIQTGCEWRLKIRINSSALETFPTTATFTAHVRRSVNDATPLVTLTTAAGTITRVDGTSLELVIPGSATADWSAGKVVMDVVRTDLTQLVHLGFELEVPVKRSITRL